MLPHALPYIFSEICLILSYLQRVTMHYRQFFKKNINIHFLKNLTVTHGNALQIAPKPCYNEWKCIKLHVVTRWSYGNALHCGLPMLNKIKCTVTRVVTHWSYGITLHYSLSMFMEFGYVVTRSNIIVMAFVRGKSIST